MLVLISFGLVLVATVLLVIGLMADSGLGFIYVSIACSLAAGIILVVATRVNRPRAEAASTGPAPLPPPEAPAETPAVTTAVAAVPAAPSDEEFAPTPSVPAAAPAVDDDLFPIADYDDLSLGEILPLLPKLYADELDVVETRERAGKSRRQIISRLGELRQAMEGAPDDLTAEEWAAQQPAATRPARKAPAKKVVAAAPAKKATPTKKAAAPAKKVAAATKKAAAPAKKAAATKKAAPAKKAAAPAKKATPTKKAAAPAKKAAKTTKATKK